MQSPIQTADRSRRAGCVCRGFFLGLALLFNGQAVWSQGVVPAIATPPPRPITLGSRTPEKEVEVQPGDTASGIGVLHLPDEASLDQMLVAMLRLNPDVFLGYNVNRLPAGAILKIPDAELVAAIPESEARRIIADQNREYAAFKAALAERSRTSSGDRIERSGTPVQPGPATPIQPRAAGAESEPVSPRSQAVIRDSDGLMGEGLHAPIPVGHSEQSLAGSLALRSPGVTAAVDSVTAPTRSPSRESGAPAVSHKPGVAEVFGQGGGRYLWTVGLVCLGLVWGWIYRRRLRNTPESTLAPSGVQSTALPEQTSSNPGAIAATDERLSRPAADVPGSAPQQSEARFLEAPKSGSPGPKPASPPLVRPVPAASEAPQRSPLVARPAHPTSPVLPAAPAENGRFDAASTRNSHRAKTEARSPAAAEPVRRQRPQDETEVARLLAILNKEKDFREDCDQALESRLRRLATSVVENERRHGRLASGSSSYRWLLRALAEPGLKDSDPKKDLKLRLLLEVRDLNRAVRMELPGLA